MNKRLFIFTAISFLLVLSNLSNAQHTPKIGELRNNIPYITHDENELILAFNRCFEDGFRTYEVYIEEVAPFEFWLFGNSRKNDEIRKGFVRLKVDGDFGLYQLLQDNIHLEFNYCTGCKNQPCSVVFDNKGKFNYCGDCPNGEKCNHTIKSLKTPFYLLLTRN